MMTLDPNAVVKILLDFAWRRRWILVLPVLLSLPLAYVATKVAPRTFVASALLMLQEASASVPLARELRYSESSNEKIAAMQALLRSEKLLTDITVELHGRAVLEDKRQLGFMRDGLRNSISVIAAGPEFVNVRLHGRDPAGMGRRLEVVLAKLLETMLSNDIDSPAAPQVVLARMNERLRDATLRLRVFSASSYIQSLAQPLGVSAPPVLAAIEAKTAELAALTEAEPSTPAQKDAVLARTEPALHQASTHTANGGTSKGAQAEASHSNAELLRARTREELVVLRAILAHADTGTTALAVVDMHRRQLQETVLDFTRSAERWRQRFGESSATGLSFMRAPERILVIDPPRDPEAPTMSRSFIALMVILAGGLMAFGAALLAELLDRRVRSPREVASVFGAPMIARLTAAKD